MSRGHTPVQSPESDVSPKSQPTPKGADYFAHRPKQTSSESKPTSETPDARTETNPPQTEPESESIVTQKDETSGKVVDVKGKGKEVEIPADASATTVGDSASSNGSSEPPSRKASVSSITWLAPRNPQLPQGNKRPHGAVRIRGASPPHRRLVMEFSVIFSPPFHTTIACKPSWVLSGEVRDRPSGQANEGCFGTVTLVRPGNATPRCPATFDACHAPNGATPQLQCGPSWSGPYCSLHCEAGSTEFHYLFLTRHRFPGLCSTDVLPEKLFGKRPSSGYLSLVVQLPAPRRRSHAGSIPVFLVTSLQSSVPPRPVLLASHCTTGDL